MRISDCSSDVCSSDHGLAVAGCEPDEMGIGPVFAVSRLLERHGLTVDDIDLWELNEAFAVQALYCRDRLAIDPERSDARREGDASVSMRNSRWRTDHKKKTRREKHDRNNHTNY